MIFFLLSLCGLVALIATDMLHGYAVTMLHQRLDALPLMTIGLSNIALQLKRDRDLKTRLQGVFLGLAFLCWGGEQLLPPGRLSTFLDEGAVTIFVIDVSTIIWGRITSPEPHVS